MTPGPAAEPMPAAERAGRFIGRRHELARLDALLHAVRSGRPRIALVDGSPGIGKTMLIERFARDLSGTQVLWASGDAAESQVPYAMVDQLLRRSGSRNTELLDGTASRLPDPVTAGSLVLEALGSSQRDTPVLIVVDDAHWADAHSLRALGFALRRLVADAVLTVIVARTEELERLPSALRRHVAFEGAERLTLQSFDDRELAELAVSHGVMDFPLRAAGRLRDHTEGNPLLATALLAELPREVWSGPLVALPAPRSYEAMVVRRLPAAGTAACALIEAAAVLGARSRLDLAVAVAGLDDPRDVLDDCVATGLVRSEVDSATERRWIRFVHPLTHAAVVGQLAPGGQMRLHEAAAAVAEDEWSRLRHRAAATAASDDALADELDAFAARETARGAWSGAATSLVAASRLSSVPTDARRRMLLAVDSMLYHGDVAQASAYEGEIAAIASGPLRDCVLGFAAMMTHRPATAERLLQSAWELADPAADPQLCATIARRFALHFMYRLRGAQSVRWSRRALALVPAGDGGVLGEMLPLGVGAAYAGDLPAGLAEIDRAATASPVGAGAVGLLRARGWLRLVQGEFGAARDDLASEARDALRVGSVGTAAFALAMQARAEYLLGEWDDAALHAGRAIVITRELDHPFLSLAVSSAVAVSAARGDWELAEQQLAMLGEHGEDYEQPVVAAAIARAQLASARGAYPDVLRSLAPVLTISPREGVDEPGCWHWPHLWAEALVQTGQLDAADAFLVVHEHLARDRARASAAPRLTRVRAQWWAATGDAERAERAFSRARTMTERLHVPMELATTELCWGQWLRSRQQRSAAHEHLVAARELYDRLGARPFRDRCDLEIQRLGLHPKGRLDADPERLTPQERAVARLVAEGLSNRAVAAELVLSIRTVEFHLTHIYAKLGIASRTQLVAVWDATPGST